MVAEASDHKPLVSKTSNSAARVEHAVPQKQTQQQTQRPPQQPKLQQSKPAAKASKSNKRLQPSSDAAAADVINAQPVATAANDTESLSTADLTQLMALVQEASHHNPDLATPSTSALAPSANAHAGIPSANLSGPKKVKSKKLSNAASASHTVITAAPTVAGAVPRSNLPKAGKEESAAQQARTTLPQSRQLQAGKPVAAAALANSTQSPDSAADNTAVAAAAAAAAAGINKQKNKLGRKARLRLKRQAHREQQEGAATDTATDSNARPADVNKHSKTGSAAKTSKAAAAAAAKGAALKARGKGEPVSGQMSAYDGQAAAVKSKGAGNAGASDQLPAGTAFDAKKKSKDLLKQTPTAANEQPPAGSAVGGKKKSKDLLEQMRSKLSGGRFRMLNEQLYTSQGEDAYNMMQGQPDLFEQYHEVKITTHFMISTSCSSMSGRTPVVAIVH